MHTDFFQTDAPYRLIARHASIFQTQSQRGWLVRMLQSRHFHWLPEYEERLKTLSESRSWYTRDRAAYMYDVFVRAGVMRPTAPTRMWQRRVRQQFHTLTFCESNPELPRIIRDLLAPYFQYISPITSFTLLLDAATNTGTNLSPDASGALWEETLKVLATVAPMRHLAVFPLQRFLEGIDMRHAAYPHSKWRTTDLRQRVAAFYQRHAQLQRTALRDRMDTIREDLMAAAWHPHRIAAALELGIPPEDL